MKFYIDGTGYKFYVNGNYIGEGVEGVMYKFNNQALKLYKQDRSKSFPKIEDKKIVYLSKIKAKHFPFPTNPVYDKTGNLIGNVSPLIKNKKDIKTLYKKDINFLIEELKEIRKEVELISSYGISFCEWDFHHNYIYNGIINFIDFDLYDIDINKDTLEILKKNNRILNRFYVINLLILKYRKNDVVKLCKGLIAEDFIKIHNMDEILFEDFLEELIKNKNVKSIDEVAKIYKKELTSTIKGSSR